MVTPDLPGNQHRIVGARRCQLVKESCIIRWQLIEDAMSVLNDKRIQKYCSLDAAGKFLRHFLYHRSAETMPNQYDLLQVALSNVGHHSANRVPVGNPHAHCPWPVTGKRGRRGAVPFVGEVAYDVMPGPSAVP